MTARVIVTAAASGIGRAIARAFVADGAGVEVCDVDDVAVEELTATDPGISATRVDLRDREAVTAWLDGALDRLGGIDVLVNNAGIKGPTAMVEDVTADEWRECMAVCLDSHFLTCRRVAPVMKAQRSGVIVNMSSTAGQVGYGMRSPYAAAKWAVIGLTKSLAIELGPYDVRCNAICPGSVAGARIDRVIAHEAHHRGVDPAAIAAEYVNGQSIRRFVEADEIASLCRFLASPSAHMITGQAITIDGHTEAYHLG